MRIDASLTLLVIRRGMHAPCCESVLWVWLDWKAPFSAVVGSLSIRACRVAAWAPVSRRGLTRTSTESWKPHLRRLELARPVTMTLGCGECTLACSSHASDGDRGANGWCDGDHNNREYGDDRGGSTFMDQCQLLKRFHGSITTRTAHDPGAHLSRP